MRLKPGEDERVDNHRNRVLAVTLKTTPQPNKSDCAVANVRAGYACLVGSARAASLPRRAAVFDGPGHAAPPARAQSLRKFADRLLCRRTVHPPAALYCLGLLIGALVTTPAMGAAPATPIPLPEFAQLPQFDAPAVSPDGRAIAFVRRDAGETQIVVQELAARSSAHIISVPEGIHADWLQWASDDYVVLATTGSGRAIFLPFGMSDHNGLHTLLNSIGRSGGIRILRGTGIVSWLPDDPAHVLVNAVGYNGMIEVGRENLGSGRMTTVVPVTTGIRYWLADLNGVVRFGWGFQAKLRTVYRSRDGRFRTGKKTPWIAQGWLPVAFETDPGKVLVSGYGESGTEEVRRLDANSGQFIETVFSDTRYSVDEIVVDRHGRPVGARYTDDHRRVRYLDPELQSLARAADQALPHTVNELTSFSDDRRILIMQAASDVDPGYFNLWDRSTGKLESIAVVMPGLDPAQMSRTRPVSYQSVDGLVIPAYLTIPAGSSGKDLPAVVLQHQGLGARADADFDFLVQFLASRGLAVLQPNGRGSSGYTRQFREAGNGQWGGLMQDDLTSAATWLVGQGIADPKRICIAGRVYGGYAAALAAIKAPEVFRCAISINGILDLAQFIETLRDSRRIRVTGTQLRNVSPYFRARSVGIPRREEIGLTGGTVSPYALAGSVGIPMLILHVRDSVEVPYSHAEAMAQRLQKLDKPVRLVDLGTGGLHVANPESRQLMLRSIETFLEAHIGSRATMQRIDPDAGITRGDSKGDPAGE